MTNEKCEMMYGKCSFLLFTALQRLDAAKDARLLEGDDRFTLLVATVILARVIVVTRPRVPVLII